jgi:uncharacterized protein (DUF2147 family)
MKRSECCNKSAFPAVLALAFLFASENIAALDELEGRWQTGEDNSVVEITQAEGVAVGKLVSSDNPNAVMGTEILRNLTEADGVWSGKIWAAKRKKLMDATITPAADSLQISVSAGIASRTLTWTRVDGGPGQDRSGTYQK